ncbi:acyltransferase family protein [Burkholderia multivorans]|uniref:acyltransferase family protein n=1 Tax=Burkholderia multivorans TaxID=87883 RepID=UPI00050E711A|nr:acyltransferase [Burkholderia multivorans]KGC03412.1 acyltransferase family protein [Burkholderia multivorans]
MNKVERYPALDAMRGIAALTVMASHIFGDVRESKWGWVVKEYIDKSPLSTMTWGISPVMFFFVLSGFVLSISAEAHDLRKLPAFWARRIVRIWVPYVVALVCFCLLSAATMKFHGGLYPWANDAFRAPFEWGDFLKHVLLIGSNYQIHYMGVSWSLVHELRVSLILPFLLVLLWSRRWTVMLLASVATFYLGHWLLDRADQSVYSIGLRNTIYVSSMFMMGIIIARYRNRIIESMRGMSRETRFVLIALAVTFYGGSFWNFGISFLPWYPIGALLGCSALVCLGITSSGKSAIVHSRFSQWLGKVSYSLYLWHPAVLMVCFRLMNESHPVAITLVAIVATFAISDISYRLVEGPSITLGRSLAKKINGALSNRAVVSSQ